MTSSFNDVVDGITAAIAIKAPVKYATTGNITLSGLAVQDNGDWSSALTENDRVLVKEQTTASENGIYKAKANTWVRADDWNGARDATKGTLVRVTDGTTLSQSYWALNTSGTITIGTTDVSFIRDNNALGTGALDDEIVTVDSLSAEVLALIATNSAHQGAWLTATAYTLGQTVTYEGILYMCTVAHTSGTFATDLAADKWVRISAPAATIGSDLASAAELPINEVGMFHDVTGTTTITSFAALDTGISKLKVLQFDGAVTITHHATNLILPNSANITTAAGDVLTFYEYAAGDWKLIASSKAILYGQAIQQNIDFNDKVLSKVNIKDYELTKASPSSSGGALTVDLSTGNVHQITLTENTSVTFINWPAGAGEVTLIVTQNSTGGWALTFAQTILWPGGYVPVFSTLAEEIDWLTFASPDGGSTIYGFAAGLAMAPGVPFTGVESADEVNIAATGKLSFTDTDGIRLVIQWGRTTVGANTGVTVTFGEAYSETPFCYGAWANNITVNGTDLSGVGADNANATSMRVFNESNNSKGCSWFALGKVAA